MCYVTLVVLIYFTDNLSKNTVGTFEGLCILYILYLLTCIYTGMTNFPTTNSNNADFGTTP